MEGDVAMEAETAFSIDLSVGVVLQKMYEELGDAGCAKEDGNDARSLDARSQCRCWGMGAGMGRPAKGGTQKSNRDHESQRRWRTGGVVAGGREVDTPANERRCRSERHGEEEEVADAMATTEEDAAVAGTVAAGSDCVGQQKLGASVDNGRWRDERWMRMVDKQMVS